MDLVNLRELIDGQGRLGIGRQTQKAIVYSPPCVLAHASHYANIGKKRPQQLSEQSQERQTVSVGNCICRSSIRSREGRLLLLVLTQGLGS